MAQSPDVLDRGFPGSAKPLLVSGGSRALIIAACGSDLVSGYYDDPDRLKMPVATKQNYSRGKADEMIGWVPQVSIEEGIGRLVAWFDRQADAA